MRTTANQGQLGYGNVAFKYLSGGWNPLPLPRGKVPAAHRLYRRGPSTSRTTEPLVRGVPGR